ncbi:hypothetical protein F5Y00DRAFT_270275 [Daldinia vernicosa]|uniref:uncharacterized protein n=1 Tax=Daldinia vernicosa TaxID=114800 RepID=UPI002007FC22|nr:uncharacterized protein F5Y00DRAFT_270275 [Daldinia vernicosa]KAI0848326.1 hypothetical protein F5Y00DRAFT_270275 [Daldinia vernicosa]
MAGKKGGDGSKKAAGQARKAETAANKAAAENAKKAAEEAADWERGAKNNSKKEAQEAKKAEQARKKAEKEALAAEEEKSLPTRPGPKNSKTAVKKTNRGLDLSQFDDKKLPTLEASGVDSALDVLDLVASNGPKMNVDRHADRRVNAAYAVFRERRLKEMKEDGTSEGLRMHTREEIIKKEWKTSPENPIHDPRNVKYNAKKDEIKAMKQGEMDRIEALYGEDSK